MGSGNLNIDSLMKNIIEPVGYKDLDHLVKFVSKRTDFNSKHLGPKGEKKVILAIPEIRA